MVRNIEPQLSDTFAELHGQKIWRVRALNRKLFDDGSTRFEAICIFFEKEALCISVDDNTDQLVMSRAMPVIFNGDGYEDLADLKACVGKEFSWSWLAKNNLGYSDLFLFSLSGIIPDFGFLCIASELLLIKASTN